MRRLSSAVSRAGAEWNRDRGNLPRPHTTHPWLPIRSPNRRSFCAESGPPRTIEIFTRRTGGREVREVLFFEPHSTARQLRSFLASFRDSKPKNSRLADLLSSRPPCESRRLSARAISRTAARGVPCAETEGRTVASARDLRLGSHRPEPASPVTSRSAPRLGSGACAKESSFGECWGWLLVGRPGRRWLRAWGLRRRCRALRRRLVRAASSG